MPENQRLNTINGTILIVDDDAGFLESIRRMLITNDCTNVLMLNDSRKVISELDRGGISVVLLDWIMPHVTGAELLDQIVAAYPNIPVIIMTAVTDTETVVKCIRQGAYDYINKPIDENRLLSCLRKAIQVSAYEERIQRLTAYLQGAPLARSEIFSEIITCSPKMQGVLKIIESVAPARSPILITGETGVGKELIARAIHRASNLTGQFIPVNVASLDDEMFSDTLFGHVKGAYTGASDARDGLVSQAAGGTLFFDEIGDMGHESQVKLLRLLQEQEYFRIGSDTVQKCKARIVAASNRNFDEMRAKGQFRQDLYFRVCGYQIHIPSLRERPEDTPLLVRHYVDKLAKELGKKPPIIPQVVLEALQEHLFIGNVRELINMVRQAVTLTNGMSLSVADFPGLSVASNNNLRIIKDKFYRFQATFEKFPSLDEVERLMVEEALHATEGSRVDAARMLGISRTTLLKKLNAEP
ncbi:MAG: sigma-54 dependent transcriptional regulator [Desulfuromonadales bacterium]